MAARGRPTPQAIQEGERPRFRDRSPDEYRHPDANPFVRTHRDFGPELLPADEVWRYRGRWADCFGREAPLHVEIGSGNGFFLAELAVRHPDWNILGIEIRYKRTVLCGRKIRDAGATHARIARYHAAFLDDLFEPGTLQGLYINHPDPWPKEKHEKNRLISRWFLEDVARLLAPGASMQLKSDFRPNIERAEHLVDHGPDDEPLPALPLQIASRSEDVTREAWGEDIETNYQRKFKLKGEPVYAIELRRCT